MKTKFNNNRKIKTHKITIDQKNYETSKVINLMYHLDYEQITSVEFLKRQIHAIQRLFLSSTNVITSAEDLSCDKHVFPFDLPFTYGLIDCHSDFFLIEITAGSVYIQAPLKVKNLVEYDVQLVKVLTWNYNNDFIFVHKL